MFGDRLAERLGDDMSEEATEDLNVGGTPRAACRS